MEVRTWRKIAEPHQMSTTVRCEEHVEKALLLPWAEGILEDGADDVDIGDKGDKGKN